MWRKRVEENESACLLLQEVTAKQFPPLEDDDYNGCSAHHRFADKFHSALPLLQRKGVGSMFVREIISSIQDRMGEELPSEDIISEALLALKQKDIPFYK